MLRLRPRLTFSPPRPTRAAARRGRARAAVLAGAVAVAALQLGVGLGSELYPRIRDPLYGDKLAKLTPLAAAGRPRVVMLGTSRTGNGFHGLRVEERSGGALTAFNFGIPASGPVTHRLYARRLIADGAAPDLLLVEVLPSMLADRPDAPLERHWVHGDRFTRSELPLLEGYGFDSADVRERWLRATLTPWSQLRCQLLARAVPSWLPWHRRFDWSRGSDPRGWGTQLRDTVTPQEAAVGHLRARQEYAPVLLHWVPGGHAGRALADLLGDCRAAGVPVKLVLMPESAAFRTLYPADVLARLDAYMAKLTADAGVDLIDARTWVPDDMFSDGHHLLRPGAEAFTDRLTDEVLLPWLRGARR